MKTSSFVCWLRAAVVCAAVGFASPVWADIPASAYVQDGLIAQWDGIDNAGTGTPVPQMKTAEPTFLTNIVFRQFREDLPCLSNPHKMYVF